MPWEGSLALVRQAIIKSPHGNRLEKPPTSPDKGFAGPVAVV